MKKSLITEQEISGKPCNLEVNVFPTRILPSKFDTIEPTYLPRNSLTPRRQYLRKKANELNVDEKWLLSIKDSRNNTGEKSFVYSKNVKDFGHTEEVTQHQTVQTLQQAFGYNECGKAFFEKTVLITSNSTDLKVKSCQHNKFGEKKCDKLTFIVSQSNHPEKNHYDFNGYECTENRNNFSRITQRTDTGGKSFSQESHIREHQKIHLGVKPIECGKNFSHNSALSLLQRIRTTDRSSGHDTCTETLDYQSTFNIRQRTHIIVKSCEGNECGKP